MTNVRLQNIRKTFGATVALADIDLEITAGELFFLLGPSGCGKSTLLRLIAGLYEPTRGRIFFNDRDVTDLHTDRRNAVMCFQSYALWPHMTVRDNVRFGLAVRGVAKAEQTRRIDEVLALVQMDKLADRRPNQLSGGQQQRVALARALAVRPDCLLLDEPLSNLDAKLRHEMRSEIRRICKSAGFTTIYVTHDQKEALSVADRIAVMDHGTLAQVGPPGELYHRPASAFVAEFIGHTNLLEGEVIEQVERTLRIKTAAGEITATLPQGVTQSQRNVTLSIRPEQMQIVAARGGGGGGGGSGGESGGGGMTARSPDPQRGTNRLVGKVRETTFLGEASEHRLDVNGSDVTVINTPPLFDVPSELAVEFDPSDVVVLLA